MQMGALDLQALGERARGLARPGGRVVLGIAGMPGAGKSTLAQALVDLLNLAPAPGAGSAAPREAGGPAGWVALLPLDGFHYPQARLVQMGLRHRMGAPETFDSTAYRKTIEQVAAGRGPVSAPSFDRTVEEPRPDGIRIEAAHLLVVTEGNYLLLPDGPWPQARRWMAQVWYVRVDERTRVSRLVERHVRFGKTREAATEWVDRSDQANARLVGRHADAADLVVDL